MACTRSVMLSSLLSGLLTGCGTSTPAAAPEADTGTASGDTEVVDTGSAVDADVACGNAVGDILCDLDLQGHMRDGLTTGLATEVPEGATKMSDVLAAGTTPYAYVYIGAFW